MATATREFRQADSAACQDLIRLIYEAAVEPSGWGSFVQALSQSCGGAAAAISLQIPSSGMPTVGARVLLLDEYAPLFTEHQKLGLPWGSLLMPLYTRQFSFGSDVLPNDELPATAYYREYMQPQGLAPEAPLAHVFAQAKGQPVAAVVIYRRVGTRPLDWRDLERCNELVPHLARAYRIHSQMHGERERRRALAEVVDRFPMGVLLLDAQRRCVILNRSAEQMFASGDGIAIRDNRPVALDAREAEKLDAAIRAASGEARSGIPGRTRLVSISRPSREAPFGVRVMPLMDVPTVSQERDCVVVLFIADGASSAIETEVLQELYSLTPAEAGLVCQMISGHSLEEAARLRGIRATTARGYLKSAYQKTGTRGQRDLIRLILTGVSPVGR